MTSPEKARVQRARFDESWRPLYWFRGDYPLTIGTTHKVASTTFANALGKRQKFLEYHTPPKDKPVLLVVRHPLDRLVSAYEWFVHSPANIIPGGGARRFGYIDFSQFLAHTDKHANMHWTPQTYQHENWREFEFLLPLEELSNWWPAELGEPLHRKKTKRKPWQEYYTAEERKRYEKKYIEDIICYERAVSQGIHTR